jgi:hypothetical protein
MVLVQAEHLSAPLGISSHCKVEGDCQWVKDGGRVANRTQQTFSRQAVRMFFGVLDLRVTVYIIEDSKALIFLFHSGDIRNLIWLLLFCKAKNVC